MLAPFNALAVSLVEFLTPTITSNSMGKVSLWLRRMSLTSCLLVIMITEWDLGLLTLDVDRENGELLHHGRNNHELDEF